MKILAIDTATATCSIACTIEDVILIETILHKKQTHSKHLFELIQSVLDLARLPINRFDGIAVCQGPGSFTGVRIGLSAAKGLAMASRLPIVGISSLEALAMQAATPGTLICPMIDARRNEVYAAGYRFEGGHLYRVIGAQATAPKRFLAAIDEPCRFVGSGAVAYHDQIADEMRELASFVPQGQHAIRASTLALLSLVRFRNRAVEDLAAFAPTYLRKSDAEMNRIHSDGHSTPAV